MKPTGHSKSKTYQNHSKTSTDIPSGYEYIKEQIKDAQDYVSSLDHWKYAVSTTGMYRDRGDAHGPVTPSGDFEGFKSSWEYYTKEQTQSHSRRLQASPFSSDKIKTSSLDKGYSMYEKPKYKNPEKRLV